MQSGIAPTLNKRFFVALQAVRKCVLGLVALLLPCLKIGRKVERAGWGEVKSLKDGRVASQKGETRALKIVYAVL